VCLRGREEVTRQTGHTDGRGPGYSRCASTMTLATLRSTAAMFFERIGRVRQKLIQRRDEMSIVGSMAVGMLSLERVFRTGTRIGSHGVTLLRQREYLSKRNLHAHRKLKEQHGTDQVSDSFEGHVGSLQ